MEIQKTKTPTTSEAKPASAPVKKAAFEAEKPLAKTSPEPVTITPFKEIPLRPNDIEHGHSMNRLEDAQARLFRKFQSGKFDPKTLVNEFDQLQVKKRSLESQPVMSKAAWDKDVMDRAIKSLR